MTGNSEVPGVLRVDDAELASFLHTVGRAEVELDLVVAGSSVALTHRLLAAPDRAVVVLGVRSGLHQVMQMPPSHLAAALVRLTRMRPRRTGERRHRRYPTAGLSALVAADPEVRLPALAEAGASFAWRLDVTWADGQSSTVSAIDGKDGLFWADRTDQVLRPVSNTMAYRVFTTVLTAGAPIPAQ